MLSAKVKKDKRNKELHTIRKEKTLKERQSFILSEKKRKDMKRKKDSCRSSLLFVSSLNLL